MELEKNKQRPKPAEGKNNKDQRGNNSFKGDSTKKRKKRRRANPIFLKQFQKTEEDGTPPNLFYEATITLIPKPDKDTTIKRKLQFNISN